jgi:PadR family transcriptional regulator, regulatory protein PadR
MTDRRAQRGPVAAPGNYVYACLLLLLAEAPNYGYGLAARLGDLGLANVDSGTVYRALRKLNDEGLVESWWEPGAGPARRRYAVTPAGAAYLEECTPTVAASSRSLGSFLARQRRLAGRSDPVAAHG